MALGKTLRRMLLWIAALMASPAMIVGCAGIRPYEHRNHREEGMEKGLFTGSKGELVIIRETDEE